MSANLNGMASTRVSRHVEAPGARVYRALLDPHAIEKWNVSAGMTCQVHTFEGRECGASEPTRRLRSSKLIADDPLN